MEMWAVSKSHERTKEILAQRDPTWKSWASEGIFFAPGIARNHYIRVFVSRLKWTLPMKKIDILNFITDFRKTPNSIKTYTELVAHLGKDNEPTLNTMLTELKQLRTIRETELNGERAFQVTSK